MQLKRQICRLTIFTVCMFLAFCFSYRSNLITVEIALNKFARGRDPCNNLGSLKDDDPQLVACLRQNFLTPPYLLPYNLTKPAVRDGTQFGQQEMVLKMHGFKRNGIFIECGGLDGELFSNTLYLEREFGWTGILIEAEANNYESIVHKRRKIWASHSCLSPTKTAEKVIFRGIPYTLGYTYRPIQPMVQTTLTLVGIDYNIENGAGGLTLIKNSTSMRNIPGNGYVETTHLPTQVQCFPLYTYFLALNITEVDYFSLDVEGADFEILKTIPFDKIVFKVLEVEVEWLDISKETVKEFLEARGYILVKEVEWDYIFVHNSFKLPEGLIL